jgi:hypothetical protein
MRAVTPKDKAIKAFHPDLPDEDERFDPLNLDQNDSTRKARENNGNPKAGTSSERFEGFIASEIVLQSRVFYGVRRTNVGAVGTFSRSPACALIRLRMMRRL